MSIAIAIIFILLSAADIATTHRFLQLGIRAQDGPDVCDRCWPAVSARVTAVGLLCHAGCVVVWNLYLIRGRS